MIHQLVKELEAQFPLKILFASEDDLQIRLHQLEVETKNKNKGIGTRVIIALQDYAKKQNKPITLEAQANPGKKTALNRFYRHLGFKKPGRRRDYRLQAGHTHIWRP